MNRKMMIFALAAASVALSACGGGGNDSPAATSQVPSSASQSVDGFIAYLKELIVASAEMLEPVDTSSVTPPASDTTEPTPVD